MPVKIDIPDSQLPKMRELYTNMAKEILARMQGLNSEWQELQPILEQLGIDLRIEKPKKRKQEPREPLLHDADVVFGYSVDWGWAKKAAFVIQIKGKPLTAKGIIDILSNEYERNLDVITAGNSLPSTLSVQARKGNFSRVLENGEYIYDLAKNEPLDN
jgi:hypothetical protein